MDFSKCKSGLLSSSSRGWYSVPLLCSCPVSLALKGLLFSPTIASIACSVSCVERVLFHLGGLGNFFCGVGEVMLFLIQKLHVAKTGLN